MRLIIIFANTICESMSQSVCILPLRLSGPRRARLRDILREGQMEAGRLWSDAVTWHREQREAGGTWPGRKEAHAWSKGRYALHSQTIQRTAYRLLENVEATMSRRRKEPETRRWLKLPWREKRFQPLSWPAQAVSYDPERRRMVLPMGRGRKSIVLKGIDLEAVGAVSICWNDGYELHVATPDPDPVRDPEATGLATVDLGQIHLATVTDDKGHAMVMSGRGIRAIKRYNSKEVGKIARKQARATKHSRRWRKLQLAKNTLKARTRRQVRDLRHKATRGVIDFCVAHGVGTLYVGDPRGVRDLKRGRKHNQRISQWELGKDMRYLEEKAKKVGIECSSGNERGTSSHCPECGHRQKARGRDWRCRACGFSGHRDVVGSVNMFPIAYGVKVTFPRRQDVTYLRPGPVRRSPQAVLAPDTGPATEYRRCRFLNHPDGSPPEDDASASSPRGERKLHVPDTVILWEETPRL